MRGAEERAGRKEFPPRPAARAILPRDHRPTPPERAPLWREPCGEEAAQRLRRRRREQEAAKASGPEIQLSADVLERERPTLVATRDPKPRLTGETHPLRLWGHLTNQAANCVNQNRAHEGALTLGSGGKEVDVRDADAET